MAPEPATDPTSCLDGQALARMPARRPKPRAPVDDCAGASAE